eukprot:69591-Pelagomonas_calceolata.AAC.1
MFGIEYRIFADGCFSPTRLRDVLKQGSEQRGLSSFERIHAAASRQQKSVISRSGGELHRGPTQLPTSDNLIN